RIGLHSGSVVAGIVGVRKFAYDIWGDAVNTAAGMEALSEPGRVNVSESTYQLIKSSFICSKREGGAPGPAGSMQMYFLEGERMAGPPAQCFAEKLPDN